MYELDLPKGWADMEISTQILIRDALAKDIQIEVIDRKENFIRLTKDGHSEFVKEATKTRLDSLMTYLVMENKIVSKLVLMENGIRVPMGSHYSTLKNALDDFNVYKDRKKVIKPVTTNYGLGIGISNQGDKFEHFQYYLEQAFTYSSSVIVEEFLEGPEYRFLVFGEEVMAVCNRVPANVIGDGQATVSELVTLKNSDPRRGVGHITPLEKIQMTEIERDVLRDQGHFFTDILPKGQVVYLRKNSNISTGGDSIDFTDLVHPDFNSIAIKAAKSAGSVICGVDIIGSNIFETPDPTTYAVLEINFNPVLYIHEYPYAGKPRRAGNKLLEMLGFI